MRKIEKKLEEQREQNTEQWQRVLEHQIVFHERYAPQLRRAIGAFEALAALEIIGEPDFNTNMRTLRVTSFGVPASQGKKVIEALRYQGFEYKSHRLDAGLSLLEYRLEYEGLQVELSLFFAGQCRKVQVGTEERPVYEVECDGEPVDTDDFAPPKEESCD